MAKIRVIPFLQGFEVKPSATSALGVVTFTDGVNELTPNQIQCEALQMKIIIRKVQEIRLKQERTTLI